MTEGELRVCSRMEAKRRYDSRKRERSVLTEAPARSSKLKELQVGLGNMEADALEKGIFRDLQEPNPS